MNGDCFMGKSLPYSDVGHMIGSIWDHIIIIYHSMVELLFMYTCKCIAKGRVLCRCLKSCFDAVSSSTDKPKSFQCM